jgi:hypothetical protein
MASKTKHYFCCSFATLTLAMLFMVGTVISAQTMPPTPKPPVSNPPPTATNNNNNNGDITHQDIVDFDRFLDDHPEIAEQLRKDPSLVDNKQWVAGHPALQEYLRDHPRISEAYRTDPNLFMKDEDRYDRREDRFARGGERNNGELTGFGQFLGNHTSISAELSKDPSLANNKEYLSTHPELQSYLQAHPAMTQQLAENPQAVMSSSWVQQSSNMGMKTTPPKTKSTPNE